MGVAFQRGEKLTKDDLFVIVEKITGSGPEPAIPFKIFYNIFDKTTGVPLLVLPLDRPMEQVEPGLFFAPWHVPPNVNFGEFEVRFSWQLDEGGLFTQQITRFHIVGNFSVLNNESLQTLIESVSSGLGGVISPATRLFLSGDIVFVVLGEDIPGNPGFF